MENKTILVLGASSDVGVDYIQKNHDKYDKIIAHYFSNDKKLIELKTSIGDKLHLVCADLSKIEAVDAMILDIEKATPSIECILHLPAPKYSVTKFKKIPVASYTNSYNVQVISILKVLQKFLPKMAKAKYGKVVFMLSSCTANDPPKYVNDYVTNKYALLGMMKSLAREFADKKLNINAISPSMMDTKFLSEIPELIVAQNTESSPRKRNAQTSDIVPMIEYLLSDRAEYITGQNILISGGTS